MRRPEPSEKELRENPPRELDDAEKRQLSVLEFVTKFNGASYR
jgi:hypothetical protein